MSPTPDMTNLQDTRPGGLLTAADFPRPRQRPSLIRTRRPFFARLWRNFYVAYLRWCERSVREERESYEDAEIDMGPDYLRNSYAQEEILRVRIADLENS